MKKVHLRFKKGENYPLCGQIKTDSITDEIDSVTCENCKKTKVYKDLKTKKESNRPLEKGEFEEPKTKHNTKPDLISTHTNITADFSNIEEPKKYEVKALESGVTLKNLNNEEFNYLFDFCEKKDYSTHSEKREGIINCYNINKSEIDDVLDFIKQGFNDLDETFKTQESFNKSLETGEVEEPLSKRLQGGNNQEDVLLDMNEQQASHYKPTTEYELETIEIIEYVLDLLKDIVTPLQGYYIGNEIKYTRRLGKKDDAKKEMYKIGDYYSRLLNNKWIHEVNKKD